MAYTAILQLPNGSTSLVPVLTPANFSQAVYRTAKPFANIVEEDGVYVELNFTDDSRKVLFPVRSPSV
ncbi:MAG: hypothetical protein R3E82_05130 [Pseudomonadales bacterium]